MGLKVIKAGPLDTLQDLGRIGYSAQGLRECGACDKYALQLANILAGNPRDLAALEMTLFGGSYLFEQDTVFALAGADMEPHLDGERISMHSPVFAGAGQVLTLQAAKTGARTYLAIHGGFDVKKELGSCSTDVRCRIGGFCGRALRVGDCLPAGDSLPAKDCLPTGDSLPAGARSEEFVNRMKRAGAPGRQQSGLAQMNQPGPAQTSRLSQQQPGPAWLSWPGTPAVSLDGKLVPLLRAVPGPQEERFTEAARAAFVSGFYSLQPDSDRMAARLWGSALEPKESVDILSDGIVEGSVQVSAGGQPMVMLADHQTTGGYAKIATVISADIPALAQRRPGERVAFRYVSVKEAEEAVRQQKKKLDWIEENFQRACGLKV